RRTPTRRAPIKWPTLPTASRGPARGEKSKRGLRGGKSGGGVRREKSRPGGRGGEGKRGPRGGRPRRGGGGERREPAGAGAEEALAGPARDSGATPVLDTRAVLGQNDAPTVVQQVEPALESRSRLVAAQPVDSIEELSEEDLIPESRVPLPELED